MKKIFSFLVTMVFVSISFAQSGGGGGAGESAEHPASHKKEKDEVRLMDESHKNSTSAHKKEKMNKKDNVSGGTGTTESKGKKKTE